MERIPNEGRDLKKRRARLCTKPTKLVAVCVSGLLVRHRTRIALAATRRATLARAAALYAERFGLPDGRIPATFEILFLTGWAP